MIYWNRNMLNCILCFIRIIYLRVQHGRWVYLLIDIYVNTVPKFVFVFSFLSYIVPTIYLVSCLRFNNYVWGKFLAVWRQSFKLLGTVNIRYNILFFSILGVENSKFDSKNVSQQRNKKINWRRTRSRVLNIAINLIYKYTLVYIFL